MAFWQEKTLAEMTSAEWESLCDGCGKCCLHKLEDEDTGEVFYTYVACKLLDTQTARCTDYPNRVAKVPECLCLKPSDVASFHWLPETCAYRLLSEGQPLAAWHPLVSGDPASVKAANVSVAGKVVAEHKVHPDDYEDCIVHWV
ncbi:YcgN family cysteine cluster protein [Saccharophagus degradans]|uniref:YcgN family cysteine cluster protein n=1 Tax=Saccharophagus degradans TaxID=86304 RepID=UPI001C0A4CE0|nr:YcgN family cysteine cluster protein [Saccharophagus degradans]MBU2986001.1 YcgN family cysteine cluster protein [Saccharophagus degradans]